MAEDQPKQSRFVLAVGGVVLLLAVVVAFLQASNWFSVPAESSRSAAAATPRRDLNYKPRSTVDTGGFQTVVANVTPWPPGASLEDVRSVWQGAGYRGMQMIDQYLVMPRSDRVEALLTKAGMANFESEPRQAYAVLAALRALVEPSDALADQWLYTVIYFQGVTALRCGETENCVLCRGESSCILPLAPTAVHADPRGSRSATEFAADYRKLDWKPIALPK